MIVTADTPAGLITGRIDGEPGDPPLLLLHGGPGLSDYMADLLAGELGGWRTICFQQRGLTPSDTGGPFTVAQHVADTTAVLDAAGVERAVVLGHSWGGHLALQFAVAHPERVTGLVIIDSLGVIDDGGMTAMGQELVGRVPPESAAALAELAGRLNGPNVTDEDALSWLRLLWPGYFADRAHALECPPGLRMSLAGNAMTAASVLESLADGFAARLSSLTIPAVFLLGERSPMPVSQGQQTAGLMPDATVQVVPGAGHLPWHEAPGCVAAALANIR
jgi:pimeloyl-ACP methyl ester carboxylesterase